jgi:hypothetical protein
MGCLDVGQGGERNHAIGFAGGVTGGEETPAGASPCLCLYDRRAPPVSVALFSLSLIQFAGPLWAF